MEMTITTTATVATATTNLSEKQQAIAGPLIGDADAANSRAASTGEPAVRTGPRAILDHMDNILAFLIRVDPAIEVAIAESTLDWDKFVKGPFEALVGAVFGKRVRYTSARVNRALVYDRLGGTVFGPEDVAGLVTDPSACAAVGLTGGHVRTLSMLCVHARTHPLASADDVRRVAKAVDGVGPWTVESAVVASLLDSDAFPREDRWVARKMRDLYGLSRIPGAAEAEALSRRWSPYRAVAVAYLWRWFDEAETRRIAKADAVAAPKTIKQSRNKTPSGNKAALASSRTR